MPSADAESAGAWTGRVAQVIQAGLIITLVLGAERFQSPID